MTDHAQIRARHSGHLRSYRQSAEYAEYARATGWPVPEGDLPSLIGRRWEIDEETYWEVLEVLPPLGHRGGSFYLSEFTFGDITTKYTKESDRYYCEFVHYPERKQAQAVQTPWGASGAVGRRERPPRY